MPCYVIDGKIVLGFGIGDTVAAGFVTGSVTGDEPTGIVDLLRIDPGTVGRSVLDEMTQEEINDLPLAARMIFLNVESLDVMLGWMTALRKQMVAASGLAETLHEVKVAIAGEPKEESRG